MTVAAETEVAEQKVVSPPSTWSMTMAKKAFAASLPLEMAVSLADGRLPHDQLTQRLRAFARDASVFVLDDGRILTMRPGLAFVFASRGAFEDHLAALAPKHPPIEDTFQQGTVLLTRCRRESDSCPSGSE